MDFVKAEVDELLLARATIKSVLKYLYSEIQIETSQQQLRVQFLHLGYEVQLNKTLNELDPDKKRADKLLCFQKEYEIQKKVMKILEE